MKPEIGKKYIITTSEWFFAPDGNSYKAVFGTINGIMNDQETLGIKTNRNSSNWYLSIGNMIIGGCQIHYAVKTDECSNFPPKRSIETNGELNHRNENISLIYFSDN